MVEVDEEIPATTKVVTMVDRTVGSIPVAAIAEEDVDEAEIVEEVKDNTISQDGDQHVVRSRSDGIFVSMSDEQKAFGVSREVG